MNTTEVFGSDLEIHEEGQFAFWMGHDISTNPYDAHSEEYQIWLGGYNDPRGDTE